MEGVKDPGQALKYISHLLSSIFLVFCQPYICISQILYLSWSNLGEETPLVKGVKDPGQALRCSS